MIFKYPNGDPVELYFVTKDLLNVLAHQVVPFNNLKKIASYHDKLTFNEVANFIAVQRAAGNLFGVDLHDAASEFGEGYNTGMISEAFNVVDSNSIQETLKGGKVFHSTRIGNVLIVAVDCKDCKEVGNWSKLNARNISLAVQETIYGRVGYLDTHFGSVLNPGLGELTMAEVYKLVHIQNT